MIFAGLFIILSFLKCLFGQDFFFFFFCVWPRRCACICGRRGSMWQESFAQTVQKKLCYVKMFHSSTAGKWSCIFTALFQSADHSKCFTTLATFSHSHIDGGGCHARQPTAHREQFGVQYLAQGHFHALLGGAGIRTSDLQITGRPAVPPELQPLKQILQPGKLTLS